MAKTEKNSTDQPSLPKEFKTLSAESVLRWLEEANQFVNSFLSPKERARWREIKDLKHQG